MGEMISTRRESQIIFRIAKEHLWKTREQHGDSFHMLMTGDTRCAPRILRGEVKSDLDVGWQELLVGGLGGRYYWAQAGLGEHAIQRIG